MGVAMNWAGRIIIRSGAVNDEIAVELQGGDRIVAVITQERHH